METLLVFRREHGVLTQNSMFKSEFKVIIEVQKQDIIKLESSVVMLKDHVQVLKQQIDNTADRCEPMNSMVVGYV